MVHTRQYLGALSLFLGVAIIGYIQYTDPNFFELRGTPSEMFLESILLTWLGLSALAKFGMMIDVRGTLAPSVFSTGIFLGLWLLSMVLSEPQPNPRPEWTWLLTLFTILFVGWGVVDFIDLTNFFRPRKNSTI